MSVLCSMCGKLSQDPEFCDHCNADLGTAGQSLPPERCPLEGDGVLLTADQRHLLLFPEASVLVQQNGHAWRIHWISALDWKDCGPPLERRLALRIPALPAGRLIDDALGRWFAVEVHHNSVLAWQDPAQTDPIQELQRLSASLFSIAAALEPLHQNSCLWLNFDPNSLEDIGPLKPQLTDTPSADWRLLRITNLDLELFPFQSMPERVRVHPHYAAPEIVQFRAEDIGPRTDVYHLAMFAYYWLAQHLPDGLPGEGLESYDYALPRLRVFAPLVPIGIIPVIQRGLAPAPKDRFESPRQFATALADAIERVQQRLSFNGALRWELGGNTRTGRTKTELHRGNEDAILIKADETSALALVADGVSTCDVGSGGLASTMTTIVVENALAEGCNHETFPDLITSAARRGSLGLLEWALAHNARADLEAGKDLMGTTLTVAWLTGRELSVANLGDSRAYLITGDAVEQLTVDGDLASDFLARGASPEEVQQLGMMARALRECVGGCAKSEDGQLGIVPECCQPRITRWPLLPGDVIVLCSDGLVEEGYFLEPDMLADMVRGNPARSAEELALMLVEAADALQRVPTIIEPDGFGDNISCVVIKIKG